MYRFTSTEDTPEAKAERLARLECLADAELLRIGRSVAFMAAGSTRETWRTQLEECRAEWRRRRPACLPDKRPGHSSCLPSSQKLESR